MIMYSFENIPHLVFFAASTISIDTTTNTTVSTTSVACEFLLVLLYVGDQELVVLGLKMC